SGGSTRASSGSPSRAAWRSSASLRCRSDLPRVVSGAPLAAARDGPGERSLGLATCTALVIGNMVGSGFFIAPAALARFGTTALIGWAVMAIGAICLGMVFARLARIAPATGGPYAYTRMGFGCLAGFLVAWGYWISIWASLPAM